MLIRYLHKRGWRLLYPPQRGKRGQTYCTVGKIVTQWCLRETYFHNVIGALVMEIFGFPFSEQCGRWQRPNPIMYRAMAVGLPLGGWGLREVNGRLDPAVEVQWRTQYLRRRNRYQKATALAVDWIARVLWLIVVRGRPPVGRHPVYWDLCERYMQRVADHPAFQATLRRHEIGG